MRRMILPVSLLLALSPFAVAAPIYKWVGAKGVTRFGAQPSQSAQATTVNTQAAPPPDNFLLPPSAPTPTVQQKPTDPEQKAIDDEVKQQVTKEEAECKQFCEETHNNLAQLKSSPRVRIDEGRGELRRLGEGERQEQIVKTKKAIQKNCR